MLTFSHKIANKMSARASVIRSLDWNFRVCFQAHSHSRWQMASLPHWLLARGLSSLSHGSLHGPFECPHDVALGFPQSEWHQRKGKEETTMPLCPNIRNDTLSSPPYSSLQKQVTRSMFKGRGIRLHLLKGEVSKNMWTYFITTKTIYKIWKTWATYNLWTNISFFYQ